MIALLCLDGPHAGLMLSPNYYEYPEGYVLWPARWIGEFHYPDALEYNGTDE